MTTPPNIPKLPTLIRRIRVANDLFTKKRTPYKALAKRYGVSRDAIKNDVKWIKNNVPIEMLQKAVSNKVLKALQEIDNPETILKYGLPFLSKAITQKAEVKGEFIKKEIKIDTTDDEDTILSRAAAILSRKTRHPPIH